VQVYNRTAEGFPKENMPQNNHTFMFSLR